MFSHLDFLEEKSIEVVATSMDEIESKLYPTPNVALILPQTQYARLC